jgi:hypothetical protein
MTDREEQLEEALLRIKQWAEAYPVEMFTPLPDAKVKMAGIVLGWVGIDIGALHAGWARHILDGIADICNKALE